MSRRHSNENALLLDIDLAQSMRDSDRNKTVLLTYGARNSLQRAESQRRVRRVRQMSDGFAIERIAGATYMKTYSLAYCVVSVRVWHFISTESRTSEEYYGACFGALHAVHDGFGIELVVGQ